MWATMLEHVVSMTKKGRGSPRRPRHCVVQNDALFKMVWIWYPITYQLKALCIIKAGKLWAVRMAFWSTLCTGHHWQRLSLHGLLYKSVSLSWYQGGHDGVMISTEEGLLFDVFGYHIPSLLASWAVSRGLQGGSWTAGFGLQSRLWPWD